MIAQTVAKACQGQGSWDQETRKRVDTLAAGNVATADRSDLAVQSYALPALLAGFHEDLRIRTDRI